MAQHEQTTPVHLIGGGEMVEHRFQLPLIADQPEGEKITVFAREYRNGDHAEEKPWLLYLQGGPGGKGNRVAMLSGWIKEATKIFRVLMLDQRGTGLSTPLTHQTVTARGDAQAQAEYLSHFRAPNIVADAEAIRKILDSEPWTTLGQSYGGFCTLTYLSFAPEGLKASMITGGLAPLSGPADQVYQATYDRMRARNAEYFAKHPGDRDLLGKIYDRVAQGDVKLPDGSALTKGRVQMLGMYLGGNTRIDALHYVLEEAFIPGTDELSDTFLDTVYSLVSRASNPMYLVMHESIYGQPGAQPTHWAAQRVLADHPDFNPAKTQHPLLTGEHCFEWYLELDPTLAPMTEVTQLLAEKDDWGALYDLEQLKKNTVPVAACVFTDDVFVERQLSLRTASQVENLQLWETDEFHHDGLAQDGAGIFSRLFSMVNTTQ